MAYKPFVLTVSQGGTGLATLTIHSVLVGNSTGAITRLTVGANNSLMAGTGGADPSFSTISTPYVTGISFDGGSNTLSAYSTGTFSPTIDNATTPPTVAYTVQVGRWTIIGNRVILNINITLSSYVSGTGQVLIKTLPFTSSASSGNQVCPIGLQNVTFGASVLWYFVGIGTSVTQATINGNRSANTSLPLATGGPSNTSIFKTTLNYEI